MGASLVLMCPAPCVCRACIRVLDERRFDVGELFARSVVGEINYVVEFIGRFHAFVEKLAVNRWAVAIKELLSRFIGFRQSDAMEIC